MSATENRAIRSVCIVGGGSAGWLTAGLIAARHGPDLAVTLVESVSRGTIGVGEGTWPTMRNTLRKIGIGETDFMRFCHASFKQGAKFARWRTGAADDFYYHPLVLPEGFPDLDLAPYWNAQAAAPGNGVPSFSDAVCFQEALCEQSLAPKLMTSPEYAGVANYAYHLDAVKLGELLARHCVDTLGVTHIDDEIVDVTLAENGDVAAVVGKRNGPIAADLYVDCTGFAARLLGEALGVPFIDRSDVLFIDRAMAVQLPVEEDSPIASHTISTAQKHGWIWDIGLPTRRGIGYVWSTRHAGADRVEEELAAYVGPGFAKLTPREIPIRSGHRELFWKNNVVAVGLAAGFLEPLEASALVLIELSADYIATSMPATRGAMDFVARRFNTMTRYRWDRIIEFLKLHYILSEREDTAFWRDNRDPATIPQDLQDQLALWRDNPPGEHDFASAHEMFPAASYQYVLYGMGFRTRPRAGQLAQRDAAEDAFTRTAAMKRKLTGMMPTNRALLGKLAQHRFPTL
ncbi:tryptophan halogenase family protein [Novosphingobium sp. SG720]|uniref:tryptophan halogenase family protein n=1 Tax=Novosphingobium sp. SG720 TaxID=2586998 RepID=UPI001444F1F5|nr:tryptophan halogenase family protein [Novosphingobium sp. SG720]NKJ44761.1 glycine/D-amino acid oxidase-like deaminating enzyme [Novosphingobium sp. SG720]